MVCLQALTVTQELRYDIKFGVINFIAILVNLNIPLIKAGLLNGVA
jgi:hypothetical protein